MQKLKIKRGRITLRGYIDKPNQKIESVVILLHGFGADCGRTKGSLINDCAKFLNYNGLLVIRVDFYGCGKSDGIFKDMSLSTQLEDVLAMVNMVNFYYPNAKVILLGFSEGGLIASLVAPTLQIDKLVLLAPAISMLTEIRRGILLGTSFDIKHIPNIINISKINQTVGKKFIIECINCSEQQISSFYGPVLYCQSLCDEYVPQEVALKYQNLYFNRIKIRKYDTSNHVFAGYNRKEMLQDIVDFIRK